MSNCDWRLACLLAASLVSGVCGCRSQHGSPPSLVDLVSNAHDTDSFRDQRALEGVLFVQMGSRPQLEAKFLYEVASGRLRMQLPDKTVILHDGRQCWVAPAASPLSEAGRTYLTWAQLIVLPFRLKEPGSQVTELGPFKIGAVECNGVRVRFDRGLGSFAKDYYLVYADVATHRVQAIAFAREGEELLQPPQAVTFYDFKNVSGCQIATEWKFWQFHRTEGIYGAPIGAGRLLNLDFVNPKKGAFDKPPDCRPVE